jgi:hypothetical protein
MVVETQVPVPEETICKNTQTNGTCHSNQSLCPSKSTASSTHKGLFQQMKERKMKYPMALFLPVALFLCTCGNFCFDGLLQIQRTDS